METTQPRCTVGIPLRAIRARVIAGPDAGTEVVADEEPITVGSADGCSLRLSDRTVSRFHVEIAAAAGGVRVRDLGSTNGVRVGAVRLLDGVVPGGTRIAIGASELSVEDAGVRSIETSASIPGLVGDSPPARTLAWSVMRAAPSVVPVLIHGESGTGKEIVARALHAKSPRAAGPFVIVDAGALAPTLVASELFGHEKGAFTGARERREGALERAHGGTLFLDEIGELPAAVQPLLLGAIARGVARRVGGDREIPLDVRFVSATHRDLRSAVNTGAFRADLYHRIAVIRVSVPPLRSRADDVPALVDHFLRAAGWTGARETIVAGDVLSRWCEHPWPGNVRELRNATLAALAMREAPDLDPVVTGAFAEHVGLPFREAREEAMARFERRYLESLLERTRQNVAEAARRAEVDRTHLHELLKRHGIR